MISTATELTQLVSDFESGLVPFEILNDELAAIGEQVAAGDDSALGTLYARLELAVAEYTGGAMDLDELREELRAIVPAVVRVQTDAPAEHVLRVLVGTGVSHISRVTQVSEGWDPSPASYTQRALVRA